MNNRPVSVVEFLRLNSGEWTAGDIAQGLGASAYDVNPELTALYKKGEVTRRKQRIHYVYQLNADRPVTDVRDMVVVTWDMLPSWVAAPREQAKQCTWLQAGDNTYYRFNSVGIYEATYQRGTAT